MERERDGIRNTLVTLRKEKSELKEELKTASGKEIQRKTHSRCSLKINSIATTYIYCMYLDYRKDGETNRGFLSKSISIFC